MSSRAAASLLALAAVAALALALASCGGEDAKLLPGNTAREIDENLTSVRALAEEGNCIEAEDRALQVSTQIEALSGIDPKLKEALRNGAQRLNEVVAGCEESGQGTGEEEAAPEEAETTEKPPGKTEKQKNKAEKGQEATPAPQAEPQLPPQANGKAKGHEAEAEPAEPEEAGGGQSGGIGPASPAESE